MFFRRSHGFPEPDPQIYSDLVDTLIDEISASYDTYLDDNIIDGIGTFETMTVYDSWSGELVNCENTFVNFILANAEYLLRRMRKGMSDEAICMVLCNDIAYVCKSFVEKRLTTRPNFGKNQGFKAVISNPRLRPLLGIEHKLSTKGQDLLKSLFLGLTAESFFKTFALDGDYFEIDATLKITFTDEVIEFWYPGGVEIAKESDEAKQSIYFWVACTLALQACILNRHAFKELNSYMSQ